MYNVERFPFIVFGNPLYLVCSQQTSNLTWIPRYAGEHCAFPHCIMNHSWSCKGTLTINSTSPQPLSILFLSFFQEAAEKQVLFDIESMPMYADLVPSNC